jgi:hypothetical protein
MSVQLRSESTKPGAVTQLGEYLFCTQKVRGSSPLSSTVTESEAVEELACEASVSEFESRQSPQMEATANGLAICLENRRIATL